MENTMIFRANILNKMFALYLPPDELKYLRGLESHILDKATHKGGQIVKLPMKEEVFAKLFKNGVNLNEYWEFYKDYDPPLVEGLYTPMPHQLETAAFLANNPRAYCTSTMRTGKTASVIMALDYLARYRNEPGATLIVCPVSVMHSVWATTILSMTDLEVGLLRGTKVQRRKELAIPRGYYIINYDGVDLLLPELSHMVAQGAIRKVVIDELNHYGNPTAKRWKAANKIFNGATPVPYLWGLTGTPTADSLAVFGYATMVNPVNMPWTNKTAWQTAVQYKWGYEAWQWSDKNDAHLTIQRVMQPNIRFKKEDVLKNLPPIMRTRREAALTKEQLTLFNKLKAEMRALTEGGEVITADQKATLISKLFQIAAGQVITKSQEVAAVAHKPRLDLLEQLISESPNKSVIFCAFRGVIEDLSKALNARGIPTEQVHGNVTGKARDKIFHDFQYLEHPKVLVAHPMTTAYGTELAAADQLILNGPLLSGTHTYMQGLERLSSIKQKSSVITVIEVVASKEEAMFFDALNKRINWANATASLFEHITRR